MNILCTIVWAKYKNNTQGCPKLPFIAVVKTPIENLNIHLYYSISDLLYLKNYVPLINNKFIYQTDTSYLNFFNDNNPLTSFFH